MKKFFLITVLFLSIFSLAQAQRNTGQRPSRSGSSDSNGRPAMMDPAERINRQTDRLKESLSLSADQVAKVKAIYTKNEEARRQAFEKARSASSNAEVDRDKMREQMRAAMTKQDEEIKAVLTAEQKVKYEQVIKEREERMKNRSNGSGGQRQNQ